MGHGFRIRCQHSRASHSRHSAFFPELDRFSSASKVHTKAGNDVVNIAGEYNLARLADGGDGNDTLLARYGNVKLIGGNGDDKLSLYDWDGISKVEMTGGSGSDRFEFGTVETAGSLRPIINDFSAKDTSRTDPSANTSRL